MVNDKVQAFFKRNKQKNVSSVTLNNNYKNLQRFNANLSYNKGCQYDLTFLLKH